MHNKANNFVILTSFFLLLTISLQTSHVIYDYVQIFIQGIKDVFPIVCALCLGHHGRYSGNVESKQG